MNLSVYGADFDGGMPLQQPLQIGEQNQIDSLVEFVSEIMLNRKNAFPENGSHNPNSKSSHQLKHSTIKMIDFRKNAEQTFVYGVAKMPDSFTINYSKLVPKEINPPPPKAC